MSKLFAYSKLIIFSLLVLSGVQIPGFVSEYGKNLNARFAESTTSIKPFQDTAKQHFDGDIKKLIQHYDKQNDEIIDEGADSINRLFQRFELLSKASSDFKSSAYSAYTQAFLRPVTDVRKQTWDNYSFNVAFNKETIGFGLIAALLIMIMFEIIVSIISRLLFRPTARKAS